MHRFLILDRDGTLTYDHGYTYRVEDFALLENAVAGLRRLAEAGFHFVLATNQSGIGRGYFGEEDMHRFNERLKAELEQQGIRLEGIYFCPFHPTEGIGPYRCESPLRKPQPGMILQAAQDLDMDLAQSYVVGDKLSDIAAGRAAGCRTVLVARNGVGPLPATPQPKPDVIARDLLEVAELIIGKKG